MLLGLGFGVTAYMSRLVELNTICFRFWMWAVGFEEEVLDCEHMLDLV